MTTATHILDDRRASVPLYPLGAAFTLGTDGDLPQDAIFRLKRRLRGRVPGSTAAWIGVLFGLLAMATSILTASLSGWRPTSFVQPVCHIAMFVSIFWTARYRFERRAAGQVRRALLAESRCPSCAYDLAGAPPQADGCVVCPECAGAWRLPAPN